jgi:hypothetical protein
MKWVNQLVAWHERLPGWAALLFYPIVTPIVMASSTVDIVVFLCFILPYWLLFPGKTENPAANFTLAEVRQHANELVQWFADALEKHPDCDWLCVSLQFAKQLAQLAEGARISPEEARQFADRASRELKGYKGIPFFALHSLSRRLVELANQSAAEPAPKLEADRADNEAP